MQNSSTTLLALLELAGFTTYAASHSQDRFYPLNGSSPSIRLPMLAVKKVELQKQDASLPDWVAMSGDMGLKFYRAVCCPEAGRARQ